jgi:hypothetical protein
VKRLDQRKRCGMRAEGAREVLGTSSVRDQLHAHFPEVSPLATFCLPLPRHSSLANFCLPLPRHSSLASFCLPLPRHSSLATFCLPLPRP